MKCVNCQTDSNLQDRTANNGKCKNCGHTFVFEPTKNIIENVNITDIFFEKTIADISVNKTLFFTAKQFQYSFDRRLKNRSSNFGGWLFGYIFFNIWTTGFVGGILSGFLGKISFILVYLILNISIVIYLFISSRSERKNYRLRQSNAKKLLVAGFLIIVVRFLFASILSAKISTVIIGLGIISIILGSIQLINKKQKHQTFLLPQTETNKWLDNWQKINTIEQLLPPPRQASLPPAVNEDITKYSFDRAIICDTAAIANFLIANNFHTENNCAILSITGYPENIFNTVREMLQNNPNLKVYALHNASPRGVELADNLRSSGKWFANTTANIYDLGILPKQILKRPALFVNNSPESARLAKQISPQVRQQLSLEEIKWLDSGNFVELESFSPQKLLQIVIKGIAQIEQLDRDSSDSDGTWEDNDSDCYIYSVESFG